MIIGNEPDQTQRPDLQPARQPCSSAQTTPHQIEIRAAERETPNHIITIAIERETIQARSIAVAQEPAALHLAEPPKAETSSTNNLPPKKHPPRYTNHSTSNEPPDFVHLVALPRDVRCARLPKCCARGSQEVPDGAYSQICSSRSPHFGSPNSPSLRLDSNAHVAYIAGRCSVPSLR